MTAARSRGRTSVQPDHEMHPRVLAGNLHAVTKVLSQGADQRPALRGVPVPARRR